MSRPKILSVSLAAVMLWLGLCAPALAVNLIGTTDLADSAVTTPKLATGAVTDEKISGTISGSKLGAHGHAGSDLVNSSVTGEKLADGAVTDSKISGPISASKIATTGLDADSVDGQHAVDFAAANHGHTELAPLDHGHDAADILSGVIGVDKVASYAGVKVVHKGPADGQNTFNTISGALAQITDNSAAKRYVVVVMPGVYEEEIDSYGNEYIDIVGESKSSVIIRGAGIGSRVITIGIYSSLQNVTVDGENIVLVDVSARGATVENCNLIVSRDNGVGVYMQVLADSSIKNVSITSGSTAGGLRMGMQLGVADNCNPDSVKIENIDIDGNFYYGVMIYGVNDPNNPPASPIKLTNSQIKIRGTHAIYLHYGYLEMTNVKAIATRNLEPPVALFVSSATNFRSTIKCNSCYFESLFSVFVNGDGEFSNSVFKGDVATQYDGTIKIGNSQVIGNLYNPQVVSPKGIKFVGSYDGNYDPIADGQY